MEPLTDLDRLAVGDLATLWADRPNAPMHIALIGSFAAPDWLDRTGELRLDRLREAVEARTHRTPVFRRRLQQTGFGEGLPLWVPDDDFDIRRHVVTAEGIDRLPDVRFLEWAGQEALRPLDRAHPLWRMTFVPGRVEGTVEMLLTVHHVAVDGPAGWRRWHRCSTATRPPGSRTCER